MKKINTRLDAITNPFYGLAPWFFRIALGVAFFIHGYKKLPAPFMIDEQHRMVTWFESIFMPMPELIVSIVIVTEILGGIGIILGGLIGFFATQAGHLLTRASGFFLVILMIYVFYIGHPDWFVLPPIKLLTSEQLFLFVLSIYFMVRGNK
jgi:uncharacterized membrane protein YphA (DoxX/SURF4 family)|tara:strand:+ start:310 stop:762 length:453 start_codon:yes stop_codon:yes gene_type:complete